MKNFSTFLLLFVCVSFAKAQEFKLMKFSSGYSNMVGLENCGDNRLFVVEQEGKIFICSATGTKDPTPFLDITDRVTFAGEQGLLGLAFDPAYASNGYFFVNYVNKAGNTQISRFRVSTDPNIANPNSEKFILSITQPFNNHKGGCTRFGPDGYLYIGMGDGGSGGDPNNNAQNTMSLLGKMLRIDVHSGAAPYNIPPDNPFVGLPNFRPEIWDLGLRNPWRWSFDALTGQLFIADVGQELWEEVDVEAKGAGGKNYGWRCYEGRHPYNLTGCQPRDNYTFPKYEYPHVDSIGGDCSVIGGFVYRGTRYPDLFGKYVFTDYCSGLFRLLYKENGDGRVRTVFDGDNSVYTSFGEDADHELYVCNEINGTIYHIAYGTAQSNFAADKDAGNNFTFVPNPARNNITITYNSNKAEQVAVKISGVLGQQVYSVSKTTIKGINTWSINLNIPSGNYYLSIISASGSVITQNLQVQ
jgi:glucose/arabinose dehydrogenase